MIGQSIATALLRRIEPETAHRLTLMGLTAGLGPRAERAESVLATRLAGLPLSNPIGLAAGFDKDAVAFAPLLRAGFGFVECGTVTPLPQAGNARPRLFRLPQDRAVINRMGFNNAGLEAFAERLAHRDRTSEASVSGAAGVVGANIGANKESADRIGDYVAAFARVFGLADYVTVNVSSPNTPGLRALQSAEALDELGARLAQARAALRAAQGGSGPPLLLKIAPDLDDSEVEALVARAATHGFDGLVVANTTLARAQDLRGRAASEAGGLSGAPLFARSTELLRLVAQAARGRGLCLVAAGGVASGEAALTKIRAGAAAVQLYTGLVYEGPGLITRLRADLAARLRAEGFIRLQDAIGT